MDQYHFSWMEAPGDAPFLGGTWYHVTDVVGEDVCRVVKTDTGWEAYSDDWYGVWGATRGAAVTNFVGATR